jgi:hypothetical protein
VQGGEDDLQRRLVRELRVRVDRDAAAVVAHCHGVVGRQLDLDAAGVAGDGLVHRVVEHLGDEVVQGALVDPADVHAGAAAHRLEALQDLDVLGGVVVGARGGACEEVGHVRSSAGLGRAIGP